MHSSSPFWISCSEFPPFRSRLDAALAGRAIMLFETGGNMGKRIIAAIAGLLLTGAAPTPPARLHGLSAGSLSSFTSTPNGCGMSILFDNWRVERGGSAPPPKYPSTRSLTFAASPAARGKSLRLDIRGAHHGAGTAKLTLVVGKLRRELAITEEDFLIRTSIPLDRATADTRLELTASIEPREAGGETALLAIDSIDAGLAGCGKGGK